MIYEWKSRLARGQILWFTAAGLSGVLVLASSCSSDCGTTFDNACEDWEDEATDEISVGDSEAPVEIHADSRVDINLLPDDPLATGDFVFVLGEGVRYKMVVTEGTVVTFDGQQLTDPSKECPSGDTYQLFVASERTEFSLSSSDPSVSLVIAPVLSDRSDCSSGDADADWD